MKTKHSEHSIILIRNLNTDSYLCALTLDTYLNFSFSMPEMWDRGTKCSKSICCPHHEGT